MARIERMFELPFSVRIETCPLILRRNKFSPDKPFAKDVFVLLLNNSTNDHPFNSDISLTDTFNPIIPKSKRKKSLFFIVDFWCKWITVVSFSRFVSIASEDIHNRNHHEHQTILFHRKIDPSMDWQRSEQVHRFSVDCAVWPQIYQLLATSKILHLMGYTSQIKRTSYFLSPVTRDRSRISTWTVPTSAVAESDVHLRKSINSLIERNFNTYR